MREKRDSEKKYEKQTLEEFEQAIKQFGDDIDVNVQNQGTGYKKYRVSLGKSYLRISCNPLSSQYYRYKKSTRPITLDFWGGVARLNKLDKSKRSYSKPASAVETAEELLRNAEKQRKREEELKKERENHEKLLAERLEELGIEECHGPLLRRREIYSQKWVSFGKHIKARANLLHEGPEIHHKKLFISGYSLSPEQVRKIEELIESFKQEEDN